MAFMAPLLAAFAPAAAGGATALGAGSALAGAAPTAAGAATGVGSALGGGGLGSLMSVVPEMGGALEGASGLFGGGGDALGSLMNMTGGTPGGGGADIGQSAPMQSLFGQESSIPGQMPGAQLMPNVNAPKEDISEGFDPYEMARKGDTELLENANEKEAIARRLEMADRGLGYAEAPPAGASSMDLKGLMDMMQGSMPSQGQQPSPNQVPAYMNKYIQGLMGGM